jgi:wobble nucleotide-excising tRNase
MGRRNSTKRILCNIAKQSEQVIILGHDAYFLRDIHDDLEKNNIEASSVKISRGNNGYSKFESANFNEKCHSEYHKKFMLLENFVKNGSGEEDKVACAIRPLLE